MTRPLRHASIGQLVLVNAICVIYYVHERTESRSTVHVRAIEQQRDNELTTLNDEFHDLNLLLLLLLNEGYSLDRAL